MNIFISIDGVLRNTIQKFEYHYKDYYINSDIDETLEQIELGDDGEIIDNGNVEELPEPKFNYDILYPIKNDDLSRYFIFQSDDEFKNFFYIEFPVEIFGHAGISYPTAFTELNKLMYDNPDLTYTVVGMDEFGKAKPSTLFFLSRNGFLGNNIRFIKSENLIDEWAKCDVWVTDNEKIINSCPKDKIVIKFETDYNSDFTTRFKINKFSNIETSWLKSSENTTTSI